MSEQEPMGKCSLCGGNFSRKSMSRHLKACGQPERKPATQPPERTFHLFVEGRFATDYWLHMAAPEEADLSELDYFLRRIWVECCGHSSAFKIEGKHYSSYAGDSGGLGMEESLSGVLQPGKRFYYDYDFGSTTKLTLKVLGFIEPVLDPDDIHLLARNDLPEIACRQCGNHLATTICLLCDYTGKNWLCESCKAIHECKEKMFLPVSNSPRAGVCVYSG